MDEISEIFQGFVAGDGSPVDDGGSPETQIGIQVQNIE